MRLRRSLVIALGVDGRDSSALVPSEAHALLADPARLAALTATAYETGYLVNAAAADLPGVAAALGGAPNLDATTLGWICGLLPDGAAAAGLEERSADPDAFRQGLALAAQQRSGRIPWLAPDADTRLDAADPLRGPTALDAVASPPGEEVWAIGWDLETLPACRVGAAGAVTVVGGAIYAEGPGYCLRLPRFGDSAASFELDVGGPFPEDPVRLRLFHLAARRSYLPNEGVVGLDVVLDDQLLASRLLVSYGHSHETEIDIPAPRLRPGRHRITLRLHETSTTTYRLYRVELR